MDLKQQKLTGEEWDSLERPVSGEELRILRLIHEGYEDVNITYNDTQSLINFIKISENLEMHHSYFFDKYFKESINILKKKYQLKFEDKKKKKKHKPLKKRDLIRISNVDKKINNLHISIIEFVLISQVEQFLKNQHSKKKNENTVSKTYYTYYTLSQLMKYNIRNVNPGVIDLVEYILREFKSKMKKKKFINYASDFIERNKELHKYRDIKLYEHQKRIFTLCKKDEAKLIMYQAPTGTGKTLTPIGLASSHDATPKKRIIFVCAAKHIGLQLAKSCISLNIKIAVAFGCSDPGGIRLHYFAAKDFTKNRRTGGIFRVDNSVGDDVQIMISDIQSYLPAMRYMLAFNKPGELIWYWDEPTITLDYEEHKYHDILQQNWQQNEIPNIILSSATLPLRDDIIPCLQSFMSKFNSTNVYSIVSHDCAKTIPLLDSKGYVILPHLVYGDFSDVKKSLKHIDSYQTILRHFDLNEITKFIIYVNKTIGIKDRYKIDTYFEEIGEIDSISIKRYYLKLLGSLKKDYKTVYDYFQTNRQPMHNSSIKITTDDAYTLTDGPTIYMASDVEKIANYCLKIAKIPERILDVILKAISSNDLIRQEIEIIEREMTKNEDSSSAADNKKNKGDSSRVQKSKKDSKEGPTDIYKKEQALLRQIEGLRGNLIKIELARVFVPNSVEHLRKYDKCSWIKKAFSSEIDGYIVEKIMLLDIEAIWKILLLMGIGVFAKHKCRDYVAIMKELAQNQQLYLIIASTDYIYGTNYQFCHGYIGKDLEELTQEKMIQALGRVGRRNTQGDYSIRLRNDELINILFMKSENKVEVNNMNRLFTEADI